jgi:hypothetical protein
MRQRSRWIIKARGKEVHVRRLQREVRLPGLKNADDIHAAARVLIDAGWLMPPPATGGVGRRKVSYIVNPRVFEVAQ